MTSSLSPRVAPAPIDAPQAVLDISSHEFREAAARVTDWIARYLEESERYPVVARVAPGDVAAQLPSSPPVAGEPMARILDDFERIIVPGTTHWNHPGFMAYFAITASGPGILGEMLAAALNTNAMLWKTGPSATELELRVLDWLRQAMGMTEGWFGVINDTASISTTLALAAAREARSELEVRTKGLAGRDLPVMRVYCSEQTHSSLDKGAIMLGFGSDNIVHIPVDEHFRMRADALGAAIARDRAAGMLPVAACATVGTTGTASVDPVREILTICRREGVWLHIDASYAGVTAILPECRAHFDGVDEADSLVVNPHKWLFTPVDVSTLYVRRPDILKRAFSLVPEFLVTHEQDQVVNLMDYGVQLGRRFRALKLWFVMRAFGVDGLSARLRQHLALAGAFAGQLEASDDWTLMAPVHFSLVCFRYAPDGIDDADCDALNQAILDRVNASGEVYLSHTKLNGRFTIRLAIGNLRTEQRHLDTAWRLLREAAADLRSPLTSGQSHLGIA